MKLAKLKTVLLFCLLVLLSGCNQTNSALNPIEVQINSVVGGASGVPEVSIDENESEVDPVNPQGPDYCLDCHINKQQLIDTAKPEEAVVVESEGEG